MRNSKKLSKDQSGKYKPGDPKYYAQYVHSQREVSDKLDLKSILMAIVIILFVGGYLYALNSKLVGVEERKIERESIRNATPTFQVLDWKGNNDD